MDMNLSKLQEIVKDRKPQVAKSRTQLSNWTTRSLALSLLRWYLNLNSKHPQRVTLFFWMSPMCTWSKHANKLLLVFLVLICLLLQESQPRIQKGRGKLFLLPYSDQRNKIWQHSIKRWDFLGGSVIKDLPAKQKMQVLSLGQEDHLEKGMATHSIILASRVPWTAEPGGL